MDNTLDFTHEEFGHILQRTSELVLAQYRNAGTQKGFNVHLQADVESWFDEPLPQTGMEIDLLFEDIQKKVMDSATGNRDALAKVPNSTF